MKKVAVAITVALVAGVLGVALVLSGSSSRVRPCTREDVSAQCNVILISLDTLRADRLGVYGYSRETSPRLDAFAKHSTVFTNVVAASNWTLPSHVSIFSGLWLSTHGVKQPQDRISAETPWIPSLLRAIGYKTFAITGGGNIGRRFGFARGFGEYKNESGIELKQVLAQIQERIHSTPPGKPFFAFVHTYDIHCPYNKAPEEIRRMFRTPDAEFVIPGCPKLNYNRMELTSGQVQFLSNGYDANIRWVDDALGDFFDYLEREDLLSTTVVVITSDHGEEFKEHGGLGHHTQYREVLMVPLIIRSPGADPRRVHDVVGLVDIAPTILDLVGVAAPTTLDGRSLASIVYGDLSTEDSSRVTVSESLNKKRHLGSLIDGEYHLIADYLSGENRLFDFRRDGLEAEDIAHSAPEIVNELRSMLENTARQDALPTGTAPAPTQEELETLRALGYVTD